MHQGTHGPQTPRAPAWDVLTSLGVAGGLSCCGSILRHGDQLIS